MQTNPCRQCGRELYIQISDQPIRCPNCGATNVQPNRQVGKPQQIQKVIQFRKRRFLSSGIDMTALNEKIAQLNSSGWVLRSIMPSATLFGVIQSYTLLLELNES